MDLAAELKSGEDLFTSGSLDAAAAKLKGLLLSDSVNDVEAVKVRRRIEHGESTAPGWAAPAVPTRGIQAPQIETDQNTAPQNQLPLGSALPIQPFDSQTPDMDVPEAPETESPGPDAQVPEAQPLGAPLAEGQTPQATQAPKTMWESLETQAH